MTVNFWGVRGSLPTPLLPEQIQAKINAVVQLIQEKDLKTLDSRQKFLASLPPCIYGTTGGNTACVQVVAKDSSQIVFDAGTGIRNMARHTTPPDDLHYSLFLSHLHWDHIQGLPFFDSIYYPDTIIDVYSPFENTEEYFATQMKRPFYPVDFSLVKKRFNFHSIAPEEKIEIGGANVSCCKMSHPGNSYSFSVTEGNKKFVYATDIELYDKNFEANSQVCKIFENADVAVMDSQYTPLEAFYKEKWGHSPFCYAIDFAAQMKIKKIFLFHHEPAYDDKKLHSILQTAKWYSDYIAERRVQVELAIEGKSIEL